MKKPLFLCGLLLTSAALAAKTAPSRDSKRAQEALGKAVCDGKGGLLVRVPADQAKNLPENLFGPAPKTAEKGKEAEPKKEDAEVRVDAAQKKGAKGKTAKSKEPPTTVLHLKARSADPESAEEEKKECLKQFNTFYARHRGLQAAVAPDVKGELSQEERERILTIMARSAPLQPLKDMTVESLAQQRADSMKLFDGETIKSEEMKGKLVLAEDKIDRSLKLRADAAALQASLSAQTQAQNIRNASNGGRGNFGVLSTRNPKGSENSSPVNFRAYENSWKAPEVQLPDSFKQFTLPDVPHPVPGEGVSRGSIFADVKEALAGLGVRILGRAMWRPAYGSGARGHAPMKITVHHSEGANRDGDEWLLDQIKGWEGDHVERGLGSMAYHWVIGRQGNIAEGQATELVGNHGGNREKDKTNTNVGNIGICLAGNYDVDVPTDKMMVSLVGLMSYLGVRYGMDISYPNFIQPHSRYAYKTCPGKNVTSVLDKLRDKTIANIIEYKNKPGINLVAVAN